VPVDDAVGKKFVRGSGMQCECRESLNPKLEIRNWKQIRKSNSK
jgi:hypothetical protein